MEVLQGRLALLDEFEAAINAANFTATKDVSYESIRTSSPSRIVEGVIEHHFVRIEWDVVRIDKPAD